MGCLVLLVRRIQTNVETTRISFGTSRNIETKWRFQKELRNSHWCVSLSALYWRSARPFVLLLRRGVGTLLSRSDLVGEARLVLVTRRMSDRTSPLKLPKRSIPRRTRAFSENLISRPTMPVVGKSK